MTESLPAHSTNKENHPVIYGVIFFCYYVPMNKNLHKGLRTWIEIDKKAIAHNFHVFRKLISKETKMFSVVKSNAYGHSIVDFAREQEKLGADFIGVDSVVEALTLRREGINKPILVLGYTLPEMIAKAASKNISITISNFESLSAAIRLNKKIKVHIKADTGMNRHGFLVGDIKKLLEKLKNNKNIVIEGLYTHFSSAKDAIHRAYTESQIKKFNIWRNAFNLIGYKLIYHASATSGTLLFPEAQFHMVRVGIGLYGIWPSDESRLFLQKKITLKPVLTWKTIVAEVKKIPKGSRVGYEGTKTISRDTTLAILPIGYWHGFPRILSNIGEVLIHGHKAKVLGRVCMDIIMVDVTDIKKVKVGDEVVLIGKQKKEEITADAISKKFNGSTYELLTRINPLIKRFYI